MTATRRAGRRRGRRGWRSAAYGMALLLTGRATGKQQIPFGSFMITGAFLVLLAQH